MTDHAHAADLLDEIIGTRGVREPVKSMLERAYQKLIRINPEWTRRRVRAVFNGEARRIDHREIAEMQMVLEARKQHAAYKEETARFTAKVLRTAPSGVGNLHP